MSIDKDFPATDRELLEAGAAFMGGTLSPERQMEIAEILFRCSSWVNNQNPDALCNLATIAIQKGKPQEARSLAIQSVAINPSGWGGWAVLGQANNKLGNFLDARICIERAIEIKPNQGELYFMLAGIWEILGNNEKAEVCYKKSLEINPNDHQTKYSWGICKMLRGDYSYGLPLYESRLEYYQPRVPVMKATIAARELQSKTATGVIIQAEQGIGDLFMMSRYAAMLRHYVDRVVLHCEDRLVDVMNRFEGFTEVVGYSTRIEEVDIPRLSCPVVSAMSLPYLAVLLGEDMYQPTATMDLSGIEIFKEEAIHFGLCHKGNPLHANDRFRSIPEDKLFEAISDNTISGFKGKFTHLSNLSIPNGWDNAISQILSCDIVITVDTAISHLSATLGKKTWMLLSAVPDWRWGEVGETTPWYPGMRIFRQKEPLKWGPVIEQVVKELEESYGK